MTTSSSISVKARGYGARSWRAIWVEDISDDLKKQAARSCVCCWGMWGPARQVWEIAVVLFQTNSHGQPALARSPRTCRACRVESEPRRSGERANSGRLWPSWPDSQMRIRRLQPRQQSRPRRGSCTVGTSGAGPKWIIWGAGLAAAGWLRAMRLKLAVYWHRELLPEVMVHPQLPEQWQSRNWWHLAPDIPSIGWTRQSASVPAEWLRRPAVDVRLYWLYEL